MDPFCLAIPGVAVGLWITPPLFLRSEEGNKQSMTMQWENDSFIGGSDKNYSNGYRLGWAMAPGKKPPIFDKALGKLFPHSVTGSGENPGELRYGMSFGQNMYTPSDITISEPQPKDRPWAGWTYIGGSITLVRGNVYHSMEIDIGMMGPASGAGWLQRTVHDCRGIDHPEGWDNQIPNELGVILDYQSGISSDVKKLSLPFIKSKIEMDVTGYGGLSLGNVYTHGLGGFMVRIGTDIKREFAAPSRIRPSMSGSDLHYGDGFDFTLYGGLEGRAVVWNSFLDGSMFQTSANVQSNTWVGDFVIGAIAYVDGFRISYSHTFRGDEFKGSTGSNNFGSLTFSWRF